MTTFSSFSDTAPSPTGDLPFTTNSGGDGTYATIQQSFLSLSVPIIALSHR
ncbi:Uncharacterised protein [Mycobacteroides abscessus subsp. abscessus]|nr:Uncharacterised protein [Mycobacteroides abscessus subsp. abscessus]